MARILLRWWRNLENPRGRKKCKNCSMAVIWSRKVEGKMRNVKETTRGNVASCYRSPKRFVPVLLTGDSSEKTSGVRRQASGAAIMGRQKSQDGCPVHAVGMPQCLRHPRQSSAGIHPKYLLTPNAFLRWMPDTNRRA